PIAGISTAPGTWQYSTSSLSVNAPGASHSVSAVFADSDGNFNNTSGSLVGGEVVARASTSTVFTFGGTPSVFGQPVTFTASVSAAGPGAGTPAGTLSFYLDAATTPVATRTLSVGQASF